MILEGFKRVGDMEWANHMGIWSVPVHFAIKFDIPLEDKYSEKLIAGKTWPPVPPVIKNISYFLCCIIFLNLLYDPTACLL